MNKIVLTMAGVVLISGCATVQNKIDSYKEKRDKVANKVIKTKKKKDCIVKCNDKYGIGLDRAACKARCAKK